MNGRSGKQSSQPRRLETTTKKQRPAPATVPRENPHDPMLRKFARTGRGAK
jgi:hypothetical protein